MLVQFRINECRDELPFLCIFISKGERVNVFMRLLMLHLITLAVQVLYLIVN